MLTLLGLRDDYAHDGRTIVEPMFDWAVPQTLRAHRAMLESLGAVYKQINAAFGQFAMGMLTASTRALASGTPADDSLYTDIEAQIRDLTERRDALASKMKSMLDSAAFQGQAIDEREALVLIFEGQVLLKEARLLALFMGCGGKAGRINSRRSTHFTPPRPQERSKTLRKVAVGRRAATES
jgi:hypothetical protein